MSSLIDAAWQDFTQGKYRVALNRFEALVDIDPENARVHIGLACCYGMLNQPEYTIKEALKALELKITAKTGEGDKLFGSISNANIAEALATEGQEIEKKFITIAGGLVKRLGKYNASVRLHRDVIVDLPFEVTAEAK